MTAQVLRMALSEYRFCQAQLLFESAAVCHHVTHPYPILNADICDVPYRVDLKSIGHSVSLLVICKIACDGRACNNCGNNNNSPTHTAVSYAKVLLKATSSSCSYLVAGDNLLCVYFGSRLARFSSIVNSTRALRQVLS